MSMSNGVTGGIFATLADLQASKPRVNTRVELVTGERYSIDAADSGGGISVNGLFANEILNTQNVRMSKLDNPLCHLFKTNKLTETLSGALTWTRSTTATYVDRYGVVRIAPIDTPREEKEGFLIESASTNLFLHSIDGSNAAWSKTSVVLTPNATDSCVDGELADRVTNSVGGAAEYLRQSIAYTDSGGEATLSFIVKPGTVASQRIQLVAVGGTTVNVNALFNYTTETFDSVTAGATAKLVKKLANDFYWLSITVAMTGDNTSIQGRLWSDDVGAWFFAGSQFEDLSFASSLIMTTTTSATRTADNVTLNAVNNVATGTMSVAFNYEYFQGNANVYSYEGVNSTNNASFYLAGTTPALYDGINTTSLSFDILIAEMQSVAIVYGTSTANAYQNGVLKSTVTMTAPDINQLKPFEIGSTNQGVGVFYGHIKDFRVYDFELNASEVGFLS